MWCKVVITIIITTHGRVYRFVQFQCQKSGFARKKKKKKRKVARA